LFKACGGSAEAMLRVVEEARSTWGSMTKRLELPLDEFSKAYDDVMTPGGNPVVGLLFPALPRVRVAKLRVDLRRALLSAAIAIQLDGKDALKKHPDPVVGGSFEYIPFKGGFELRSKWKLDEKLRSKWKLGEQFAAPVKLTIGRRE
jgi:hypothetical protein